MHNSVKNSATDVGLGASLIVCRGGGCSFLWSLIGHLLVVLALLQLGQRVAGEPPHGLVNDVQFVREVPSTAPSVPPAGEAAPQLPSAPVAKPAASPPRPVAAPRRVSAAATITPAAIMASDGKAEADGGEAPMAAHAAVPATAPGYHLGAVETPAPDYPFAARKRRRQGLVLVRLDVGADGRVDRVVLVESSGDNALDEAAMTTLGRWRLRPATENNRPVAGRVEVPVRFRLE